MRSSSRNHILFLNILLGLIGNYLAYKGYRTGGMLAFVRMLHFIPYFGLGIFYRQSLEKYEMKLKTKYLLSILFLIKLSMFLFGCPQLFNPAWCNDFPRNPFIPIIVSYVGIAFWVRIATLLKPIGEKKYVRLIADNTYSIMMNHIIFFMGIKTLFGVMSKFTSHCQNFDWTKYKTDSSYLYIPKGARQNLIIYLVAGIIGPILIQLIINKIKTRLWTKPNLPVPINKDEYTS